MSTPYAMGFPSSNLNDRFADEVNQILAEAGFAFRVAGEDFWVWPQAIVESTANFSRQLATVVWPPIYDGDFYHYTKRPAAESIVQTRSLRLYWLKRRVSEMEVSFALQRFGFDYPLGLDAVTNQPRFVESIAERRFYVSLTNTNLNKSVEEDFWRYFAKDDGARFRFRVRAGSGFVRPMLYGDQLNRVAKLIRRIQDVAKRTFSRPFHWDDASVACGVALPETFSAESETRIILTGALGLDVQVDGDHKYLSLNFGDNALPKINLELLEIESHRELPPVPGVTMILRS